MNDLLKFLSKQLHPFGYHITKRTAPNLLKINNVEADSKNKQTITIPRRHFDKATFSDHNPLNYNTLSIFYRTCLRKNRNLNQKPRVCGDNNDQLVFSCLNSLIIALEKFKQHYPEIELTFYWLDDHSDPNYYTVLEKQLLQSSLSVEIVDLINSGQGQSLHQQFSLARKQNGLCYFIEDDYLHEEDALIVLYRFYQMLVKQCAVHSMLYMQEAEELYKDQYPSYLLKGEDRHWRTIRHATHSFFIHSYFVDYFWDYFENTKFVGIRRHRKKGSERKTTNRLFLHLPGFAPLKPVAVHLQFEETLPPFYDWDPLYKKNRVHQQEND